MQGTKDRTVELGTTAEVQRGGRGRTLAGGALALALLAGGVTAGALAPDLDGGPKRVASTQDAPEAQAPQTAQDRGAQPPAGGAAAPDSGSDSASGTGTGDRPETSSGDGAGAPPAAPAGNAAARDTVPAGTYGVRVLAQGWDERGRYVLLDRGRLSDGPPAEPGVDGTRPVVFDTGAVAERRRVDLADGHSLRFSRSGGEPSYGSGSWADFVTELSGRDAGMLATVQIDADGRLVSLEEPYRP